MAKLTSKQLASIGKKPKPKTKPKQDPVYCAFCEIEINDAVVTSLYKQGKYHAKCATI